MKISEKQCQAYGCGWPARFEVRLSRKLKGGQEVDEYVLYCRSHAEGMQEFAGAEILSSGEGSAEFM